MPADEYKAPHFKVPAIAGLGIEVYHSLPVTRWLRVTADVQVIRPADGSKRTAVVGGLRTSVLF